MGSDTLILDPDEQLDLTYQMVDSGGVVIITKSVIFYGNSYISSHDFSIDNEGLDLSANIEIIWDGGLRPTEERVEEDVQYGSGIISQAGEIDDIQVGGAENIVEREVYKGQTEWVAVRTKYFISALLVENPGSYAVLSAENVSFGSRKQTPLYNAGIGFPYDASFVSSRIYLGPLDVDHVSGVGSGLDKTMNWGFALIRPISKGVLWILKFMHKTFNLNYGIVLLIFAVLIRFVSGPLTKKSFESSQNMQKIQPELKKVQSKYKGDPQGLNRETMALYKKHKVNPLGGCLPLLLQMPLLWALFIVFRTTIEFRGAPFVFWINDLSKPDVVFNLPFSIPIYGSGVAILPLLMGATLILTMRMTSASMEKSQKPVMYFMNVFFVLLFNTFPSGLNLYYTAYNLLSFLQQRSIRTKSENK
jgi:YidC/Oxa1 family membrane protein insertase